MREGGREGAARGVIGGRCGPDADTNWTDSGAAREARTEKTIDGPLQGGGARGTTSALKWKHGANSSGGGGGGGGGE